jgi:hypothetical protein
MTSFLKIAFLLLALVSCTTVPQPSKFTKPELEVSRINLSPDNKCAMYNGDVCVAPIFDQPPDSTCSSYQGTICVAPIIPLSQ